MGEGDRGSASPVEDVNPPDELTDRPKSVKFWRLFRHADCLDVVMVLMATVMSIAAGAAVPLESFLLGRLYNIFISYSTGEQLSNLLFVNGTNGSCTTAVIQQQLSQNTTNSSTQIFCDVFQKGNVINSALIYVCDPDTTLTEEAIDFSVYFGIVAAGVFVTWFLAHSLWSISAYRQSKRMRIAFYRAVLRHDIGWFDTNDTSRLGPLFVKGVENIQAGIGTQAGLVIRDLSIFVGGIFSAFIINWKLALVVFTLFPVLSLLGGLNLRTGRISAEREERAYLKAGSVSSEVLSAVRTVLAFGGEDKEEARYRVHAKEAEVQAVRGGFLTSLFLGGMFFVGLGMFGVAFWYGSVLITDCEIVGGDVLTVTTLVLYGALSLGIALPQIGSFLSAATSAADVFNVIDEFPPKPTVGHKPKSCTGQIKFSGVHFSYPSRPHVQVLNGLSLIIEPGQTVAIVGPSGNGKSTILQLIQQLYSPDCGQVLIDGLRVEEIDPVWLHNNVGIVTQEPVLFNTTIRENIRLAKPQATPEEIKAVAVKANAHSFVTELPDGYDTYVGEGGIQLSAGQKQRIAIARALIRNARILLLDEATSALDMHSESLVQSALERASKGRTTVIVAHRLSTVRNADKIYCVNKGMVEEAGTHEQLMEKRGVYSELVGVQLKGGTAHDDDESLKPEHYPFKVRTLSMRSANLEKASRKRVNKLRRSNSINTHGWVDYSPPHAKSRQPIDVLNVNGSGKTGTRAKLMNLWKFIRPDWFIVLIGVLFYAIIGATYPTVGVLIANLNAIYGESDREAIIELSRNVSLGLIALSIAAGFFYFTGSFIVKLSGERLTTRLRVQLFKAMLHNDVEWYDDEEHTTGSLNAMLYIDANNVKAGTGIRLGTIVLATTSVITALAVCFYSSWELSLVAILAIPLIFASFRLTYVLYRSSSLEGSNSLQESTHTVIETIEHIKTVISLGAEEYFVNSVDTRLRSHTVRSVKKSLLQGFAVSLSRAAFLGVYSASFRLAAHLVTQGRISVLGVLRVITAVILTARNVTYALNSAPESSQAYESGGKILSVIQDCENSQQLRRGDKNLETTFGRIESNSVFFAYPCRPDVNVLQGLSVSVLPGETLALVGASGGGKSTLISLIEKFYHPSAGLITLDGVDIVSLDIKWLRSQIGYVPQEPVLFNTTIADNIRYGALFRDVTDEEIVKVAKDCHIHDFIQSLPQGYSTNVGIRGTQLSGGQKQRVAIARALLRNPKILVLDEATSSLDAENEQAVQQTLKTAQVGRTSIVVAHRLSTIRHADCIAVVQDGQVAESGTHASLMAEKGAYYSLVMKNI